MKLTADLDELDKALEEMLAIDLTLEFAELRDFELANDELTKDELGKDERTEDE